MLVDAEATHNLFLEDLPPLLLLHSDRVLDRFIANFTSGSSLLVAVRAAMLLYDWSLPSPESLLAAASVIAISLSECMLCVGAACAASFSSAVGSVK